MSGRSLRKQFRDAEICSKIIKNKIFRFVIVGGCSTMIDFFVYMLVSVKLDINVAKGISMICSSVFSYIANKNYTFSNKEKTNAIYLVKFYLVFGANFIVNLGTNRLVYSVTENKVIAFIFATICGMTVNYIGQRFVVFYKKN